MSEFEDKLHAILSDPAEMERISRLASELMGGGTDGPAAADESGDGTLLHRLGALLGGAGGGDKEALVRALAPYLRPRGGWSGWRMRERRTRRLHRLHPAMPQGRRRGKEDRPARFPG